MPSMLVHAALAGLIAGTLLHREFDLRTLAVVVGVTVLPDLDAFVGLVVEGTHRAALHTLLFPAVLCVAFVLDLRRDESFVRRRYGSRGVRVGGVALVSLLFAGILPDVTHTGANLLYPLHDRFYTLDGELLLSSQRGVVQTFVELDPATGGDAAAGGTTNDTHHPSVVDPEKGDEPEEVERKLWIVGSGLKALLVAISSVVVSLRLAERRLLGSGGE